MSFLLEHHLCEIGCNVCIFLSIYFSNRIYHVIFAKTKNTHLKKNSAYSKKKHPTATLINNNNNGNCQSQIGCVTSIVSQSPCQIITTSTSFIHSINPSNPCTTTTSTTTTITTMATTIATNSCSSANNSISCNPQLRSIHQSSSYHRRHSVSGIEN